MYFYMTEILLTGAKYLMIIFMAYFVYISFRAQRDVPDEKKKATFILQRIFIFLTHALAFFCICVNITLNPDINFNIPHAIGLYLGQVAYLVIMCIVIPRFVSLSNGLNNVMCMFIAIGFIIQTRLNYETSVRQFIILIVGTAIFVVFVFLCKKAKFLRNLTWVYCIAGMILLLMVLILSRVTQGAKLALDLGFFSFQPMEFVKIIFVMFVASAFYKSKSLKMVLITAACAAVHVLIVVFCRDLGSALILFVIYVLMLYVATRKLSYLGISVGCFAIASVIAYFVFNHVQVRILTWLNPWTDMDNKGYQITQSLFAIGTGGWFGSGLFRGSPKQVPVVSNDMVISAISEEMGAIFAIFLILLCLCFVLMIMRVAIRVNNQFYKLLAFGLGTSYAIQVFLTIGGAIKFIPLTGVNLPFISSGGSSLIASMVMIGIIQAVYVISEADVKAERVMIEQGVDIEEFENLDDRKIKKVHEKAFKDLKVVPINEDSIANATTEEKRYLKNKIKEVNPDDFDEDDYIAKEKNNKIIHIDPDDF